MSLIRTYTSDSHTHSHDYYQWVFPLSGTLEMEIDTTAGLVQSDQAALIPAGEKHCFSAAGNNQFLVLDKESSPSWVHHVVPHFWKLNPVFTSYLQFAKNYLEVNQYTVSSQLTVKEFLVKLLEQHFIPVFDQRIARAVDWINANYSQPIHLNQVANYACLSTSQLQRRFKHALGLSIGEYWRGKRLERAKVLLSTSNISIEEISHQVGYESVAAFSRRFTQTFSVCPTEWRRMLFSAK